MDPLVPRFCSNRGRAGSVSSISLMFDVGRAIALAWALYVVFRARRRVASVVVAFATYLYALELAAGFTIRGQGPLAPMLASMLVFIGPSGMPPGPLPPLPFASMLIASPPLLHGLACVVLAGAFAAVHVRASRLRPETTDARRLSSAALGLLIVSVLEAIEAAALLLPLLADRGF